jgi:geranylgeranyl diphosphate synthase type I
MRPDAADGPQRTAEALLDPLRSRIDDVLVGFLDARRAETAALAPEAAALIDEISRLLRAGGKRIRPALCYWGYRATGTPDGEAILRPAAALELLHTFALIHDDVMDEASTRRGVETSRVAFASASASGSASGEPMPGERVARAAAILAGDLAAALADELFFEAELPREVLDRAFARLGRMRLEMASGQFLDVMAGREARAGGAAGVGTDEETARRISALKTGSYTIEGPLQIGAILGGGSIELLTMLSRFGAPLGEAFQIGDDLDGVVGADDALEAGGANVVLAIASRLATPAERRMLEDPETRTAEEVRAVIASTGAAFRALELRDSLVRRARAALDPSLLPESSLAALGQAADLVSAPESG